ncbi:MAG: T9SS type A sorting domain-containing protein [Bacteroidetes bacterium]|nr:T9SS type A sorting domain-containing protein [Bacteroidota bacterium]
MKKLFLIPIALLSINLAFSQGDCTSQVALCSGGVTGTCANGSNDAELVVGNRGCLTSNESTNRSYWYSVCFSTTGTFQFTLNPNGGSNDMDWGMWGPNPTCPISTTTAPIRCSYAAVGGSDNTGINSANNAPATDLTEGAAGNQWVQDLAVTAGQCYYILINQYGGGGNTFSITTGGTATVNCATALPMELLSFDAHLNADKVEVTWTTASETNNDYFTIQKSKDAQIFEDLFQVDGAGNSTSIINYFDMDRSPYEGLSYYRLAQTDYNGFVSHSNIVPVEYHPNGESSINLFPNPLDESAISYLELNQFGEQEVLVVLRDVLGKELFTKVIITKSNNELVAINQDGNLPKGAYLITASSNNKIYSKRLIVK